MTAGGQASNTTGVPLSLLTGLTALVGGSATGLSRPETWSNNLQSSSQQEAGQSAGSLPPHPEIQGTARVAHQRGRHQNIPGYPQALPWEPTRHSGVLSWWLPKMWPKRTHDKFLQCSPANALLSTEAQAETVNLSSKLVRHTRCLRPLNPPRV